MNGTLNDTIQPSAAEVANGWNPTLIWRPVRGSDLACCCPSRPVFQVVLPPLEPRSMPVEILLCAHHYRISQSALDRQGGAIYDTYGRAVALPA
jgi:hypothetical protein